MLKLWHTQRRCRLFRGPLAASVPAGGPCSGAGSEVVNGDCSLPLRAPLPNCSLSQLCGGGSGAAPAGTRLCWHTPAPALVRQRTEPRHTGRGEGEVGAPGSFQRGLCGCVGMLRRRWCPAEPGM